MLTKITETLWLDLDQVNGVYVSENCGFISLKNDGGLKVGLSDVNHLIAVLNSAPSFPRSEHMKQILFHKLLSELRDAVGTVFENEDIRLAA